MFIDPSVASKIEIVFCSVDTDPCGVALVVVYVWVIEAETVLYVEVLLEAPIGVVEVKTVSYGEVLLVVLVGVLEVVPGL